MGSKTIKSKKCRTSAKTAQEIEGAFLQKLKFYPQYGLFCIDSKVRRKYEDRKSDRKPESVAATAGATAADYSDATSSDEDEMEPVPAAEEAKSEVSQRCTVAPATAAEAKSELPLPKNMNGAHGKPQFAFKLDLSKCKFDRTKESPVELELSIPFMFLGLRGNKWIEKQSAKGKRQPVVIPKLPIPLYPVDGLTIPAAKSSIRISSRRSDARKGEEIDKFKAVLNCIKEVFGMEISGEIPIGRIKETLCEYVSGKQLEAEDLLAHAAQYKELWKAEKEKHALSRDKLKLMAGEINSLREKLRTNKENDLTHKSLTSQLLAYQILHKKDMEAKTALMEEVAKLQQEVAELKSKHSEAAGNHEKGKAENTKDPGLQSENEYLRAKNQALAAEYKRLKEDMDETVSQLIVPIFVLANNKK